MLVDNKIVNFAFGAGFGVVSVSVCLNSSVPADKTAAGKDKTTPVEKKGGEKDETTTVSKDKKELVDTTSEENKDDNANVENKLSGEELKVVSKENKKGKNCLPC